MTEPFVTAFEAAKHLAYKPESDSSRDPEMRAFRAFADRNLRAQKHRIGGRLLFKLSEIDARVTSMREVSAEDEPPVDPSLHEAQQMAIRVSRGEHLPGRVRRFPRSVAGGAR